MSINIGGGELKELKPRILVLGVGGAGGNYINAIRLKLEWKVEFVAVNTDAQDLKMSKAHAKIQIGMNLTKGLELEQNMILVTAADESLNEIMNYIQGKYGFYHFRNGWWDGNRSVSKIAKAARELNILTVGVTTLPFSYLAQKE